MSIVAVSALLHENEMEKVATRWVMTNQTDGRIFVPEGSVMKRFEGVGRIFRRYF